MSGNPMDTEDVIIESIESETSNINPSDINLDFTSSTINYPTPNKSRKTIFEYLESGLSSLAQILHLENPENVYEVYKPRYTAYRLKILFSIILIVIGLTTGTSTSYASFFTELEKAFFIIAGLSCYSLAIVEKRKAEQEAQFMNDTHNLLKKLIKK